MRAQWSLSLMAACLIVSGCSSVGLGRSDSRSTDSQSTSTSRRSAGGSNEEALKARIRELQQQAAMSQVEITRLRQQMAALQVEVERIAAQADRGLRTPQVTTPSIPAPQRFEESELEQVSVPVEPSAASVPSDFYSEPPELVETTPPTPGAIQDTAPRWVTDDEGSTEEPVPLAGQAIYDRGYTLYHQGRYLDAETSFQRFIQAHGATELADNAQFWIGECRFAREDYVGGLLAFQEVLDRYPRGNKVGDALLKVGDSLARLDDRTGANQKYREVLDRFPGSAAAAMASNRIADQ